MIINEKIKNIYKNDNSNDVSDSDDDNDIDNNGKGGSDNSINNSNMVVIKELMIKLNIMLIDNDVGNKYNNDNINDTDDNKVIKVIRRIVI